MLNTLNHLGSRYGGAASYLKWGRASHPRRSGRHGAGFLSEIATPGVRRSPPWLLTCRRCPCRGRARGVGAAEAQHREEDDGPPDRRAEKEIVSPLAGHRDLPSRDGAA
jgi:hypothetical protein